MTNGIKGHESKPKLKEAGMKLSKLSLILPAAAALMLNCGKLQAQENGAQEIASGDITQGSLRLVKDGKTLELPLKHTDVDAKITGYIARVKVVQHYTNPYDKPIEAVYVFPLPENSAVDDMTMKIGDKIIKGVIKKREEAKQIYEQAKQQGKTASLLEQERPNIFTQSVANILPGDDIYIEISYVQDLRYDHGTYEYQFPMVVGPRYIPGEQSGKNTGGGWSDNTDRVPDASRITPPVLKPEYRSGHDISLKLTVDAGVPIQNFTCPSHKIKELSKTESSVTVEIEQGDQIPNKDFIFRYDVAGKKPEYALLTHATAEGDGYFMLMIQPKAEFKIDEITPRDLIFVLDCSGSMSGEPIEKVKEAMRMTIENMHPKDYFQIIKFSNQPESFAEAPVPNTPENVKKALAYIDQIDGNGGTEMLLGVNKALSYPRNPERRRFVFFMSDGYVGNEAEIVAAVEQNRGDARVFSMGVGSSPNRFLISKIAEAGRGYAVYCRQDEDPKKAVTLFYERIAKPFLMDIEIDWGGLQVAEVFPKEVPDLFAGQPVIIHGRYTKSGQATIKIKGKIAGKPVVQEIPVVFPAVQNEHDVIATLWARTKIEKLMDDSYNQGETEDIVNAVTELALKYKIMSKYTSFVAVSEEVRNVGGKQETVQVPIPMPEGVSYEGVFGEEAEMSRSMGGMGYAPVPANGKLASKQYYISPSTTATKTKDESDDKPQEIPVSGTASYENLTILGGLDEASATQVLDAAKTKIESMYLQHLHLDASLAGRVVLSITLKADGSIDDVTVKSSTTGNDKFDKALKAEVKKLRFPASSDGGKVIITVAWVFNI